MTASDRPERGAVPPTGQPFDPSPLVDDRPARVTRSTTDRMIGGVCGGLGRYFNVDPLWFRLIFAVLALGSGAGILLYLVAWVIIPEEEPQDEGAVRTITPIVGRHGSGPSGSVIAGLALVTIGAALLIEAVVPWFDRVLWPLAVMVVGLGLVLAGMRK